MELISFGATSGHLMNELLTQDGISEVDDNTVRVQPESDRAAMQLLRRAAEGGWIVEFLDAGDEPDTGEGDAVELSLCSNGEIAGYTLDKDGNRDGGFLRLAINKIDKVHIF